MSNSPAAPSNPLTRLHPEWNSLPQREKLRILVRETGVWYTAWVLALRLGQRLGRPVGFVKEAGLRNSLAYLALRCLDRLVRVPVDRYPQPLVAVGNKTLDAGLVDQDSVVYSFGVGTHIQFDLELAESRGCQVHLFDPTPRSVEFMKGKVNHLQLHFEPIGIWTENARMKFYTDHTPGGKNHSIINLFNTEDYFLADCKTLRQIMLDCGHREVDLLKIDIEGAAIPVLNSIIADGLRPRQVCAEFEPPGVLWGEPFASVFRFYRDRRRLLERLREAGYQLVYFKGGEATLVLKS